MTSQSKKIVAGFDMDGVIIDHTPNKLALAESYAIRLHPEETHSERLHLRFARNEYAAFQDELYGNSDFALSAPLMEGAYDTLSVLKDSGVPFVLISRRKNPDNAIALLTRRGLWGTVFTETNTFFVSQPEDKNIIGIREGVTHFFDDERRVLRVMPDIPSRYLFDTFNQFEDEKVFARVSHWGMVAKLLGA